MAEPFLAAIDFFGLVATPEAEVRAALALEEGQPWQPDLLEPAWERLAKAFDLLDLRLTPVGYGDARVFLTIDVVEAGQQLSEWREPAGGVAVPPALIEVLNRYNETRETFWKLNRAVDERISPQGHFASSDEALLRIEHQAARLLDAQLEVALDAVRDADDEELRAGLVYMLGWAADKSRVTAALLDALFDVSAWVRNNAARALLPLALRAVRQGDLALPPEPLIALLAMPSTGDRARAAALLQILAADPVVRNRLRMQALPSLRAMVALRQPSNRTTAQALLAMLELDEPPLVELEQHDLAVLMRLAEALLAAPSATEAEALLDPDPAAPAWRQLAESVFAAEEARPQIAARLHSLRLLDAERVRVLLALTITTDDGAQPSGFAFVARRVGEDWKAWSL